MARSRARARVRPKPAKPAKPRLRPSQQPFNPLKSPYKTVGDFNRGVNQGARAQVQPELDQINAERRDATSTHRQRGADLNNWYGAGTQAAQSGFDRYAAATKALLGSLQGFEGDAQAGLTAAIRQQSSAANDEAAKLGVAAPASETNSGAAGAVAAYGGANALGLTGDIAAGLGRSAADIGITGIQGREAGQRERERYNTVTKDLTTRREDVIGRIPALRAQLRQSMSQEELGRAGQAFQQHLAQEQFGETVRSNKAGEGIQRGNLHVAQGQLGLAQSQFGEDKRHNRVGERQADTQLGIDQQNANTQAAQIAEQIKHERDPEKKAALQARAKRWDAGVQLLATATGQQDNDKVKNDDGSVNLKKTNARIHARLKGQFGAIRDRIMATTGMGPVEALEVMATSNDNGWRTHALKEIKRIKIKRALRGVPKPKGNHPYKAPGPPLSGTFPR